MQTDPGGLLTNNQRDNDAPVYMVEFNWPKDCSDLTLGRSGTWTNETPYLEDIKAKQRVTEPQQTVLLPAAIPPWELDLTLANDSARFSAQRSDSALYSHIAGGKFYQVPVRAWGGFWDPAPVSLSAFAVLLSSMDASQTTLLTDTFYVAIGMILKVDNEYMPIVDIDGSTVYVQRGFWDSTPAAHLSASQLYRAGAMVRKFTGIVQSHPENPADQSIDIGAVDRRHIDVQNQARSSVYENSVSQSLTPPELIGLYLDLLPATPGFAPAPAGQRDFDAGLTVQPYGFLDDESLFEECGKVAASDGGIFYADEYGRMVYRNAQRWMGAAAVWTFNEDEWQNVQPSDQYKEIFSDVILKWSPRVQGPYQRVFSAAQIFTVPAGGTYTTDFRLNWPCLSVSQPAGGAAPAADADDTRNFVANAGNLDITGDVTISSFTVYGQSVTVEFTNANAQQAEITRFEIWGVPILGGPQKEHRETATTTPSNIAKRVKQLGSDQKENWYLQTDLQAQTLAPFFLDRAKTLRKKYLIQNARGVPMLQCGDLVLLSWSRVFSTPPYAYMLEIEWGIEGIRSGKPRMYTSGRALDATGLFQANDGADYYVVGADLPDGSKKAWY